MSNIVKNTIIFIAISFFGILGIIDTYNNSSWDLIPSLWQGVLFIASFCAIVYSLFYILKGKKGREPFRKSVFVLSFYVLIILILGFRNSDYCKAKTLLYANCGDGIGSTSLELFGDNTYEVQNGSFAGGDYYMGTYSINRDTIIIDKEIHFYLDFYLSKKMLLESKEIYQLNSNNKILENEMHFPVIYDNRIKND